MKKFLKILEKSKNVAILTHTNPDGDAYGSCMMIHEFLRANFPTLKVDIFLDTNEIPEKFKPMFNGVNVNTQKRSYDLTISVDCGDESRFSKFSDIFSSSSHTASFDHHPNNPNFAELNYVNLVSSNCENLYWLLKSTKLKMSKKLLKFCYVGMLTDTKNFTINSVNEKTFRTIEEIIESGVDIHKIYECIFEGKEKGALKLLGIAIQKAKFYFDNKVIISALTKTDFKKCGLNEDDTHGIISDLFDCKESLACFFMTPRNGKTHISMRSKENIDVSTIARQLGGGGHVMASACEVKDSTKHLSEFIIEKIRPQIENYKPVCSNIFDEND